ncbi:MAG: hypothetical protein FJX76_23515 [Armatimonadetes bacterium]|nr:hypothetical protein [Armatimonadota bacterium]
MFNRSFFARDFTKLIDKYAEDKKSETPVVEFHLRDGSRYYVEAIELVGEEWLSFRAAPDPRVSPSETGRAPDQITCPYTLITRVNFFPRVSESKVGFRISR